MITRTTSPKYFAPVTLNQLDAKGALKELKFDAQFKRLKQSEKDALIAANDAKALERQLLMAPVLRRQADAAMGLDVADQISAQECMEIKQSINEQVRAEFVETLNTYMVGWSAVQDEQGGAVPYGTQARDELFEEHAGMLVATAMAFYQSLDPKAAAHLAAKN